METARIVGSAALVCLALVPVGCTRDPLMSPAADDTGGGSSTGETTGTTSTTSATTGSTSAADEPPPFVDCELTFNEGVSSVDNECPPEVANVLCRERRARTSWLYAYMTFGRPRHATDPRGQFLWEYDYDFAHRLTRLIDDYAQWTWTYDDLGRVAQISRELAQTQRTTVATLSYDERGWLVRIDDVPTDGAGDTATHELVWDDAGGLVSMRSETAYSSQFDAFTLDDRGRLIRHTRDIDDDGSADFEYEYTYDEERLLTSWEREGDAVPCEYDYVYDDAPLDTPVLIRHSPHAAWGSEPPFVRTGPPQRPWRVYLGAGSNNLAFVAAMPEYRPDRRPLEKARRTGATCRPIRLTYATNSEGHVVVGSEDSLNELEFGPPEECAPR